MQKALFHLLATAVVITAGSAFGQQQSLAERLMDADETQFVVIFPKLKEHAEHEIPILIDEIERKSPADANRDSRETLAKRQVNAAVALLKLGQGEKVWPILKHTPDPRVRSYLIHRLAPLGADPKILIKRLDDEPDITIRRALLLSLGEFYPLALSLESRKAVLPKLQDIFCNDSDPGLHAASEWLLRTWQQDRWVKQIVNAWANDPVQREGRLEAIQNSTEENRGCAQWYVNGQGQTLVVIWGAVEFQMDLPIEEADKSQKPIHHTMRIGRTFCLSAKPITIKEFREFDGDHSLPDAYDRTPDLPVVKTSWHRATAYCNWLSKQEGISEDQWCFDIIGKETNLKQNHLSLTGYRLPTEAEIEYATRAGAITSRHYGETDDLFPKYAWLATNSRQRIWPVGRLKPNDLGLFDVQGNVLTWCLENLVNYPAKNAKAQILDDLEHDLKVDYKRSRVLHGGSFVIEPTLMRSSYRFNALPESAFTDMGFRLARTLPSGCSKSAGATASKESEIGKCSGKP